MDLAVDAANETGRGVAEDKAIKNIYASEYIFGTTSVTIRLLVLSKTMMKTKLSKLLIHFGVIAGIVPVTNPTSTTIFKSIISAKTRNTIIFSFHRQAMKSSIKTAKILQRSC